MRAYLFVFALLLAIFGSIAGYMYRQFSALQAMDFSPPPITVGEAIARSESWSSTLEAVGTIAAVRGVELSTEESGEILAIDFVSGSYVEAGALLITLNDTVEQASRRRQMATLELAQLLYDRDKELIAKKSIPKSQYDRSTADLETAIASLAETEARLENKRIRAPFSGTVGLLNVKVGDYVEPGDPISTLQDLDELEVNFTLPVRHYPRLHPGLAISVRVAAFPGHIFRATLAALNSRADPSTRNLQLRATLQKGDGLLPGMFAQLTVDLARPTDLITVPETSISYSLHGNLVYVIEGSDSALHVTPRIVKTGESRDGRAAILDGLEAGERVVSAGQNKLSSGARIVVDESVQF